MISIIGFAKWISQLLATKQDKKNARGNTTCPTLIPKKTLKCLFTRKINRCCSLCNDCITIATIQVRTTIVQTMNDITETQRSLKKRKIRFEIGTRKITF